MDVWLENWLITDWPAEQLDGWSDRWMVGWLSTMHPVVGCSVSGWLNDGWWVGWLPVDWLAASVAASLVITDQV